MCSSIRTTIERLINNYITFKIMYEIFQQLGLEDREIKIYLELLKSGQSKAGNLAKRTNIDRSVVYKLLYKLINKGFVSFVIRENRKYFQSTNPEKLLDILKEREERLKEIIPNLREMKSPQIEAQVEVYKGKEGFKTVMNDLLKYDNKLYGIGYTAQGPKILKYWYEQWNKKRIEKRIRRIYLVSKEIAEKEATKRRFTTIKIMPQGFISPASTIVYGDNVVIFFPETEDFTGIIIRSRKIARSYKSFFYTLWGLSKSKEISF